MIRLYCLLNYALVTTTVHVTTDHHHRGTDIIYIVLYNSDVVRLFFKIYFPRTLETSIFSAVKGINNIKINT